MSPFRDQRRDHTWKKPPALVLLRQFFFSQRQRCSSASYKPLTLKKTQSLPVDKIDHRANEREKQEQPWREAHQATIKPPAPSLENRPLRRPGRPLRKRGRRDVHFSEGCHADPWSPVHQPPRTAAGSDAWRTSIAVINANDMVAPRSTLLPLSSAETYGHGKTQMDRGRLIWAGQQNGTAISPPAAAVSAAAALASAAAADSGGAGTSYSRQNANTASSSSLSSPPRARQKRPRPSFPPASSLASSVTRLIFSETYLRRLFVTPSLSHVLSLDACLPRTIREKINSPSPLPLLLFFLRGRRKTSEFTEGEESSLSFPASLFEVEER